MPVDSPSARVAMLAMVHSERLARSVLGQRVVPLRQPDQRIAHGCRGRGGGHFPVVSRTDAALGRGQFRGEFPFLHPGVATTGVLTAR